MLHECQATDGTVRAATSTSEDAVFAVAFFPPGPFWEGPCFYQIENVGKSSQFSDVIPSNLLGLPLKGTGKTCVPATSSASRVARGHSFPHWSEGFNDMSSLSGNFLEEDARFLQIFHVRDLLLISPRISYSHCFQFTLGNRRSSHALV